MALLKCNNAHACKLAYVSTTDSMQCGLDMSNYWVTSSEFYSPEMKISIKRLLAFNSKELNWRDELKEDSNVLT